MSNSRKPLGSTLSWLLLASGAVLIPLLLNNYAQAGGISMPGDYQLLNSATQYLINVGQNDTGPEKQVVDISIDRIRFKAANFPKSMNILGREITCDFVELDEIYVEPTWACENITVDGNRLPYAYIGDAKRREEDLSDKDYYQCGMYNPLHDGQALCRHMLAQLAGFSTDVHFVLITSASCQTIDNGIMFMRDFSHHLKYSWILRKPAFGYTKSLRCGAMR